MMTIFFDKLFFNYYHFQVRIGNPEIAPLMSSLFISFIMILYYFAGFFFLIIFFPKESFQSNIEIFKILTFIFISLLIITFPTFYLYKKRYQAVLTRYSKNQHEGRMTSIVFFIVAFILFNAGWILKMLQNQGRWQY